MQTDFLSISGITTADRHQVTSDIREAISGAGGWVVDHTLSSNIALTIRCSLPSQQLDEFQKRIVAAQVKLKDDSIAGIQAMTAKHSAEPNDISATLNVTFIHDEPDLRREVPAVPG